jgi:hypothetical protein
VKIDGACHCGNISYEAEIDPEDVAVCHCTDCQILSGSAYRTIVYVTDDKLIFSGGSPKIYNKEAESGNPRQQAFCPECGTQLYATAVGDGPKTYGIRLGTARQRDQLPPKKQLWCRSALDWVMDLENVPTVEKQ